MNGLDEEGCFWAASRVLTRKTGNLKITGKATNFVGVPRFTGAPQVALAA